MRGTELLSMLRRSYEGVNPSLPPKRRERSSHRSRSQKWVDQLARQLQNKYPRNLGYRVFWLGNRESRRDFGLNELLFDIAVCRVSRAKSPVHARELHLVSRSIWQVESEFAKNGRQALFDFNKLVMGDSIHKLFIAPLVSPVSEYLELLEAAARHCTGTLFVAMVPHPSDWSDYHASDISLVKYRGGKWNHQR